MYLPNKVEIVEVCPRDGFQNVKEFIDTDRKIEIIKKLIDSGFKRVEITSFVNPKWIPQMKDAAEVVTAIKEYSKGKDVGLIGLVPNKRGVENALSVGVDELTYVISVSERHNKENVNRTVEESMNQFAEIVTEKKNEVKFRLALATTFGCPFGEEIKTEKIISMAKKGLELGASEILLADTVGLGNPLLVENVMKEVVKEIDVNKICMHMHDTRGLALANMIAAMKYGVTKFETAAGGLGGCPFAPGASGNAATEDLLNMLNSMGIAVDIDGEKLAEAVGIIREYVNSPIVSHMSSLCKA